MKRSLQKIPPGLSALLEVGVLFLPAIPAYLWVWPNVEGTTAEVFQIIAYLYVLAGTLLIGLHRWSLNELGVNRKGFGLTLACGLAILAGRLLIILVTDFGLERPQYSPLGLLGRVVYYIGVVGLVEELLYRGLVYYALQTWLGVRWAIWGSTLGFVLWHVFGHGLLVSAGAFLVGIIFATIRWRGGGILGLVLLHGLYDLETTLLVSDQEIADLSRLGIQNIFLAYLGFAMMLIVPVWLWVVHPRVERLIDRRSE
jgi:membrane protease YdiL (CAAX protease family)